MREVVFDIEANGLLDTITKVWVIAAKDMQSGRKYVFTDEDCDFGNINGSLEQGVRFLIQYDKIIAHNIMGYDYHVLEKFFPKIWDRKTVPFSKIWDTFIQSKCQIFDRPRIKGTASLHGLEYYGVLFKRPKPPIEDWSYFDEEKLHRVIEDIEINAEAYNYLNKEADKIGLDFTKAIRRTQAASYWYAKQELYGTKGDLEHMKKCVEDLDILTEELRQEVEPLLPKQLKVKSTKCTWQDISNKWERFYRRVPKTQYDNEGKVIKPAYMPTLRVKLKSGMYDKHTANHFDIPVDPVMSNELVGGEYTKIEYLEPKMSQHQVIKDYLLSIGWIPTQFNYEKGKDGSFIRDSRGKLIEKSPKLTEDSFDSIEGEVGQKIAKYNTYMHRRRTFLNDKDDSKGWINQLRSDGRIASGCMAFATSTGRAAQRGIVNVPSPAALYGAEMRKAWVAEKGYKLVSVDMDSAQLRILANFMGDPVYTDAVLTGMEFDNDGNYVGTDPHTINAQAFGVMSPDMVIEARETQDQKLIKTLSDIRKYSKNGIYCVPMDTKALTRRGWLHYDEIEEGDEVMGYDPKDRTKKWTRVLKKEKFSDAPVVEFGHSTVKMRATPDHRWFVKRRKHEGNRSIADSAHKVLTTDELDSTCSIIMNAPMHPDEDVCGTGTREVMQEKWGKDWVQRVLDMSQSERVAFLEGFLIADGHWIDKTGVWQFSQNDNELCEAALTAAYLVHGGVIQVSHRKPYDKVMKSVKLTKKNHRGLTTAKFKQLEKQDVWCIQTELGSWVMRQGDIISITGNCYLFGGGDLKLATTLKMRTAAEGNRVKETFMDKLPAMAELQERLRKQFRENKYGRGGFIEVAGNTHVYCMSDHKLLNYLLMGSEAVLQNEAVCWLNVQTERGGIRGGQILSVHDELTGEYLEEDVPKAVEMMSEMYGAASKRIGLEVLVTGTAKFGDSWYDVH
jgi:hypothetical protein